MAGDNELNCGNRAMRVTIGHYAEIYRQTKTNGTKAFSSFRKTCGQPCGISCSSMAGATETELGRPTFGMRDNTRVAQSAAGGNSEFRFYGVADGNASNGV